jgi:hypothetical protein
VESRARGHLDKRLLAVRLGEDRGAGGRPVDDARELLRILAQCACHSVEREGLGAHAVPRLGDEAFAVGGAGAGQPALHGVDHAGVPGPREPQCHGGVDAPAVGGADAGMALAPIALLRARVEDEYVVTLALDDHGADGADHDDHTLRPREWVGTHGAEDLLGQLFPRERVPHLLAGHAQLVGGGDDGELSGVFGEQGIGQR